jgi:hypothetical protein
MYGYAGAPTAGEMTQSMQNQLANQAVAQAGVTGVYYAPNYTPQAQQQTSSWDQLSQQIQQAAGTGYNDAAAKAAYANMTGQNVQNLQGNQAAPLTQAQVQTLYNAGGVPMQNPGQGGVGGTGGQGGGVMTLQAQQQQQQAAQAYLQLLSQLQGPADYGKYLNVLGSTPGGLQSLVGAAAGQYVPGTGTTGVQPQGQTLANLVNSGTSGYSQGGGQGYQQPTGNMQYDVMQGQQNQLSAQQQAQLSGQSGMAGMQAFTGNNATGGVAGGGPAPTGTLGWNGVQGAMARPQQQASSAYQQPGGSMSLQNPYGGGGGTSYGDFMNAASNLVAPNQIAPQSYNAMTDTQKQLMQSMYAQQGYAPTDVGQLFNQSLPKYAAGGGQTTGSFKLV